MRDRREFLKLLGAGAAIAPIIGGGNTDRINGVLSARGGQPSASLPCWAPRVLCVAGSLIVDTNGNVQKIAIDGISGDSKPSWGHKVGTLTRDNNVTWINVGPVK